MMSSFVLATQRILYHRDGELSLTDQSDDNLSSISETQGLLNTLYINLILFAFFMTFFEVNRHMRSTYLKRVTKRFQRCNRVPPPPSTFPFAWILTVMDVEEEDFLRMVGLDGYMLMRYINVCFRMSVFFTIWGLIALVPVYGHAPGKHVAWNKYTLANIPNDPKADQLWVPAIFAYVFSIYFCHLMYTEYKNFVKKRVQYLIQGDPDTPPQTYYTVMVEKVPISLRSAPALEAFFEKLFPGGVYSVEVALDLSELDALTLERRLVRNALEKSIAQYKATGKRPIKWIRKDFYKDSQELALMPAENNAMARFLGYIVVDAIAHLTRVLVTLNEGVRLLQIATFQQRQKIDEEETERQQNIRGKIEVHATQVAGRLRDHTVKSLDNVSAKVSSMFANSGGRTGTMVTSTSTGGTMGSTSTVDAFLGLGTGMRSSSGDTAALTGMTGMTQINTDRDGATFDDGYNMESKRSPLLLGDSLPPMRAADAAPAEDAAIHVSSPFKVPVHSYSGDATDVHATHAAERKAVHNGSNHNSAKNSGKSGSEKGPANQTNCNVSIGRAMLTIGAKVVRGSVGGLAQEGYKTASIATRGALRGVLEGIRAVELLTVGAYYKTSSTAFVTLKSRVAECSSHQMFLSHLHYSMQVKSAPNPKDCIWENISIPPKQIAMRRTIADFTLIVGAVFWSIVVGFITAIANLESLSKELPFLQAYRNTIVYDVLNNYLAVALLLILLSLLPMVFDLIARSYEGLKLESEIQNSIMTRYFYYQLANVFVSVGLGSIASSLHQIIENPSSILSILGTSLPSLSMYFTNLLIVKTFTAVPLEMLRVWPLIEILSVRMCQDKKKCTIRELKTGAFANPPMLYGWIYPNLLMVLMIISTYCCIAPLLVPFGMLFYAFSYVMYKYQLLYVYINDYQSGGYMWYAVFNRSMLALICGVLTLLGYLGIRETFFSGPFYLLAPLPFGISYFWYKCEDRFKVASMNLSLDSAVDLDRETAHRIGAGLPVPQNTFKPSLFRQPSLAEGPIRPKAYRSRGGRSSKTSTPVARSRQLDEMWGSSKREGGKYGGLGSTTTTPRDWTGSATTPLKLTTRSDLRNVTFTETGEYSVDDSKLEGEMAPVGLDELGVGISVFASPLHRFEYHSPSPSRERLLRTPREGDVEGGFVSDEGDSEDSEDERDEEAHEILMPEGEGADRTGRSNSDNLSGSMSRNSSDADLRALDAMSQTHSAASVALLDRVSTYRERQSSHAHAHRSHLELGLTGRGAVGLGMGEEAEDEASPILPSAATKSSSPVGSGANSINGERSGGNNLRGYGSTE